MNSHVKVCDYMSRQNCVRKFVEKGFSKIFAYPQNDAREVARIMKDINIDCIPVLCSPWDRKLIGVIELRKIRSFLND